MQHPLITYWQSTFSQYMYAEGKFSLPLFPDPLMSPNFIGGGPHLNKISNAGEQAPANYILSRQFKVGTCDLTNWPDQKYRTEILPLHVAIVRSEFWPILEASFPKDIGFLGKLLPFLPVTNAIYKTIFIKEENEICGLVNIGISGGVALVLNAAVLPQHRGKNFCRDIVGIAGTVAKKYGSSRAVFWTDQTFLLKYAHEVHDYHIYLRENRPEAAQDNRPAQEA